jgi:hypothetical protein
MSGSELSIANSGSQIFKDICCLKSGYVTELTLIILFAVFLS